MDTVTTPTTPTDPVTVALHPVLCVDCDQYVPFGWIDTLGVKCPKNIGATGVRYGHRIPRAVYDNVRDLAANGTLAR